MQDEASRAVAALIRARFPRLGEAGRDDLRQLAAEAGRLAEDAARMRGRLGPGDPPDLQAALAAGAAHGDR